MRIIIKPFGLVVLVFAMLLLAFGKVGVHPASPRSEDSDSAVANATTAVAHPAPVAVSVLRQGAVYDEGTLNGWETRGWSWAKKVDYLDRTRAHSGSLSIKADLSNFEGLKFHHAAFDSAPFDRVSFWVYGGPMGGQTIQLAGDRASGAGKQAVNPALAPLPAGKWALAVVPLSAIGLAHCPDMDSFSLRMNAGGSQFPVWIDDIRLLKSGEAVAAEASAALPLQ